LFSPIYSRAIPEEQQLTTPLKDATTTTLVLAKIEA
jgi:hypothetical protein